MFTHDRRGAARWLVVLAAITSGCSTLTAVQRASVLPERELELTPQVALSPWCGLQGSLELGCATTLEGVRWPELRLSARYGLSPRADVGATAHVLLNTGPGLLTPIWRAGLAVDLKRELWSSGHWIVSAGAQPEYAAEAGNGHWVHAPRLTVPVWLGHRLGNWELVAGALLGAGLVLDPSAALEAERLRGDLRFGLSVAAVRSAGFAVQLGYLAPVLQPGEGSWLLVFAFPLRWTADRAE